MRALSYGSGASPYREIGAASGGGEVRRVIAAFLSNTTTTPQSIVAPVAGTYRLVLVGPGGSGAATSDGSSGISGGGGSGGVVVSKAISLAAGQSLSVALGAPGAKRTSRGNGPLDGNPGSAATTATMPDGAALAAGPGGGGVGRGVGSAAGGVGGTATGGEFNYPGNAGGNATYNTALMAGTALPGGIEVVAVGQSSLTPSYGSKGEAYDRFYAGGGGNTPSANGLIPLSPGSNGAAVYQNEQYSGTGYAGPISLTGFPGAVGQGGGGGVQNSSTYATSGAGGQGAAFLILEISG